MGDMYDIALGDGEQQKRGAVLIYTALGIAQGAVPRFRDAWLEIDTDGTLQIALYTRVGGNNRESYLEQIEPIESHPLYRRTDNDTFDETYTTFRFTFPPTLPEHLRDVQGYDEAVWIALGSDLRDSAEPEPVDMDAKWQAAIADLDKNGLSERQQEKMAPTLEALKQALENPGDGPTIIHL